MTTIDDFSQLNKTVVDKILYPRTIQEMQAIVAHATSTGKKISVAGKLHSQGGHAFYVDNVVIDIRNYNKIIKLDKKKKLITVQTGVTWEQIQKYINPYNLAIKVMQTAHIFTVGGSLSVNAHGRDPKFGPLIETIQAIRIVLASGEIVEASRTKNYELFRLAIGGYGLFGIILEADIQLTDNCIYQKKTRVIDVDEYPTLVKNTVIGNHQLGLHYGMISLAPYNAFKKMLVINYHAVDTHQKFPASVYQLKEEKFVAISKKRLELIRSSPFFRYVSAVGEWPFHILYERGTNLTCRNNAMRHPVACAEHTATTTTDVLQSYFIPLDSFVDFMRYLKHHAQEQSLKILYVLTRFIPKNTESFLCYTWDNYFEIVLFINHGTSLQDTTHAQAWTQQVIDKVLSYGGTFYLPVRLNASAEQLRKAYPQIDEFFQKKRTYDPQDLFMNHFYKQYAC